ncbi:P-loop containing nucleoside triphosphate hydrolase protein [Obelidium mucronatum]|nr:P-loop containing nucleoside triphosphate hydrolase protein [Obelidium mucronatum]
MTALFESNCFKTQRNLIDKLRAAGLDRYVELPQIATMGDTSSGKSSVLSAISGITFPSSSELTTRCPTQLILSQSETFSGSVRLQRFKPQQNEEPPETKTLTNANEIEHEIERLTRQLVQENQAISDDSIIINVSGPNYPNLTLTDLPGLIRTVEDSEDPAIIGRVRALVDRYLVQSRTVILAVVPANVDVHNTEILQAAEAADPLGVRTISIITKPDLIDIGAEGQVVELLLNRKKMLKLGYHAVKCRGQKDLNDGVSIADGITKEAEFFETHAVWRKVDPSYFGIGRLTEKLVKILEAVIGGSLPAVIKEIDQRLGSVEKELEELGTPLESAASRQLYYYSLLESIQEIVGKAASGNYDHEFFLNSDDDIDNRTRALIRDKECVFRKAVTMTEVEELHVSSQSPPEIGNLVEVYLIKKWCLSRVTSVSSENILCDRQPSTWIAKGSGWRHISTMDLSSLKEKIQRNRGDELPIFPSYNLFCSLIREYIRQWDKPMTQLLNETEKILTSVVQEALQFGISSRFPKLKEFISSLFAQVVKSTKTSALAVLKNALQTELRPYTLNHYLYDILIKLRNKPLLDSLEGLCSESSRTVNMDAVLAVLKHHGIGNVSNEDREAMELQLAIKAYLKVAKKRFTDTIPMLIEQYFIRVVLLQIKAALSGANDAQLASILVEPGNVVGRRVQLEAELASLMESKKEISAIYFG